MSDIEPGRKEISLAEAMDLAGPSAEEMNAGRKQGNVNTADMQVSGFCTIFDKDGNIKSTMDITSIEVADECEAAKQELENGTSNSIT